MSSIGAAAAAPTWSPFQADLLAAQEGAVAPVPPWREQLEHVKTHLESIVNPYVVVDLLDAFNEMELLIISSQNSLEGELKDCCPQEIRGLIKVLNQSLINEIQKNQSQEIHSFKDELKALRAFFLEKNQQKIRNIERWTFKRRVAGEEVAAKPLSLLYQMNEIKMLPNKTLQQVEELLESGTTGECLEGHLKKELAPEAQQSISKQLKTYKYDFYSLLADIVRAKPKVDNSIWAHWNSLQGKFCRISDQNEGLQIQGVIDKVETRNKNSVSFYLTGPQNPKVTISDLTCTVTIYNKLPLLEVLKKPLVPEQLIEITKGSFQRCYVKPGYYVVEQKKITPETKQKGLRFFSSSEKRGYDRLDAASCTEIILTNATDPTFNYKLHVYNSDLKEEGRFIYTFNDEIVPRTQLDTILVSKSKTVLCTYGSRKEATQAISVEEKKNSEVNKLQYLKEIQGLEMQLVKELTQTEGLFNELMQNLMSHKLIAVDYCDATPAFATLRDEIKNIIARYKKQMGIDKSFEDLLKRIVLAANHNKLIHKEENLSVSSTMHLLNGAMESVGTVSGKDVAIFVGNTGAGKSTTVAKLLGADLEPGEIAGDPIFRYAPDQDVSKFPVIGQTIGESETLHATGYPIDEDSGLLDCPGFEETRGEDFEMCGSLSIDEAIRCIRSIRSVIAVVPAASFTNDKAVPALRLIETIRDRFINAFTPNQDPNSFFLLITKVNTITEPQRVELANGNRFKKFLTEINDKIAALTSKIGRNAPSPFQMASLRERQRIWSTLVEMQENGQVDLLDLRHCDTQEELLRKYNSPSHTVSKTSYSRAMREDSGLQRKLGANVEMAAKTWEDLIFLRYLEKLPTELAKIHSQLDAKEKEKCLKEKNVDELDAEKTILRAQSQAVTNLLGQQDINFDDDSLPAEIKSQIEDLWQKCSSLLQSYYSDSLTVVETINEKIRAKEASIVSTQTAIEDKLSKIPETSDAIDTLGQGTTDDVLWSFKGYEKGKTLDVFSWVSNERRQIVFSEDREPGPEDKLEGSDRKLDLDTYDGYVCHIARISKQYKVLPSDPEMLKKFEEAVGSGKFETQIEKYRVTLKGAHFTCDLGAIAKTDKMVRYGFQTHWKPGRARPSIEIVHTIPNAEYNRAQIVNLDANMTILKVEKIQLEVELQKHKNDLSKLIEDKQLYQSKVEYLEQQIAEEKELAGNQSRELLEGHNQGLLDLITNLEKEKTVTVTGITHLGSEIEALKGQLEEKEREKKHLAVLIETEWNSGEILKKFAEIITGEMNEAKAAGLEKAAKKGSTIDACVSFLAVYREHAENIRKQVKEELQIS